MILSYVISFKNRCRNELLFSPLTHSNSYCRGWAFVPSGRFRASISKSVSVISAFGKNFVTSPRRHPENSDILRIISWKSDDLLTDEYLNLAPRAVFPLICLSLGGIIASVAVKSYFLSVTRNQRRHLRTERPFLQPGETPGVLAAERG